MEHSLFSMHRKGRRIQSLILMWSSRIILFHCMCTDAAMQHIDKVPEDTRLLFMFLHFFEIIISDVCTRLRVVLKSNHTQLSSKQLRHIQAGIEHYDL